MGQGLEKCLLSTARKQGLGTAGVGMAEFGAGNLGWVQKQNQDRNRNRSRNSMQNWPFKWVDVVCKTVIEMVYKVGVGMVL